MQSLKQKYPLPITLQQKFDKILKEYQKRALKHQNSHTDQTEFMYKFISDRFLHWQIKQLYTLQEHQQHDDEGDHDPYTIKCMPSSFPMAETAMGSLFAVMHG